MLKARLFVGTLNIINPCFFKRGRNKLFCINKLF